MLHGRRLSPRRTQPQVTLTDCVPAVLRTLAASVALNTQCPDVAADDSTTQTQAWVMAPLTGVIK